MIKNELPIVTVGKFLQLKILERWVLRENIDCLLVLEFGSLRLKKSSICTVVCRSTSLERRAVFLR